MIRAGLRWLGPLQSGVCAGPRGDVLNKDRRVMEGGKLTGRHPARRFASPLAGRWKISAGGSGRPAEECRTGRGKLACRGWRAGRESRDGKRRREKPSPLPAMVRGGTGCGEGGLRKERYCAGAAAVAVAGGANASVRETTFSCAFRSSSEAALVAVIWTVAPGRMSK